MALRRRPRSAALAQPAQPARDRDRLALAQRQARPLAAPLWRERLRADRRRLPPLRPGARPAADRQGRSREPWPAPADAGPGDAGTTSRSTGSPSASTRMPAETRKLLVFVPRHHLYPAPGSAGAATCSTSASAGSWRSRGQRPNAEVIRFLASRARSPPKTTRWWDAVHARPETMARGLAGARPARSRARPAHEVRILAPGPAAERLGAMNAGASGGVPAASQHAVEAAPHEANASRHDGLAADRAELDARGCATTGVLLRPAECEALAAALRRRGAVPLAHRHGAARVRAGRVQVFRLPACRRWCMSCGPRSIRRLARRRQPMGGGARPRRPISRPSTPPISAQCHAAGQTRPTPLLLQYGPGDYNCLHQDLYGELHFPLQVAFLLSRPGEDFAGGEFVLTEQRPRMQSRAEVVALATGRGGDLRREPAAGAGQHAASTASRCGTA